MNDIFDQLDRIIDAAYFVPLGVGDALAVQFKAPQLKGLAPETIAGVFNLIDTMEFPVPQDGEPSPARTAKDFFQALSERFPEVYDLWTNEDDTLVLDPLGAFQLAVTRGEKALEAWMFDQEKDFDPAQLDKARRNGLAVVLNSLDPEKYPDDRSFRNALKSELPAAFPSRIRPWLYLDAWTEYVKAVMDLDPKPEVRLRWPY